VKYNIVYLIKYQLKERTWITWYRAVERSDIHEIPNYGHGFGEKLIFAS